MSICRGHRRRSYVPLINEQHPAPEVRRKYGGMSLARQYRRRIFCEKQWIDRAYLFLSTWYLAGGFDVICHSRGVLSPLSMPPKRVNHLGTCNTVVRAKP